MRGGYCGLRLATLASLALIASHASAQLRVDGSLLAEDPPTVKLTVHNTGDAAVTDVTPTVMFEHRSYDGPPETIAPGGLKEWRVSLPPPAAPGTVPASVHVTWLDAARARHMVPFVVLVSTAGAPPASVALTWALEPAAPVAHTRLSLENRSPRPLAGRIAVVLPGDLVTEPESQAVTVAANAIATVPLAIESRGATPGIYPAYTIFTYSDGGQPHAALAGGDITVKPGSGKRAIPLAVGGAALLLVSSLLGLALRASRPSRT